MATNNSINSISLSGDVTGSGAHAIVTSISANAVANSQLAQMAADTFKANNTGSTANAADITVAQAWTLLGTIPAANLIPLGNSGVSMIGNTTHDISVTGTQAITGVGFQPSLVFLIASTSGVAASNASIGMDNNSARMCIYDVGAVTASDWAISFTQSIIVQGTSGNQATAKITAFGSDGFTLTWAKTGTPTGTTNIGYLCFK